MLIMGLRIAGGALLFLTALGLMFAGLGGLCGFLALICAGLVLGGAGEEAFVLFWGIGRESFMLFLVISTASLFLSVADLGFLGNLSGGLALAMFGLALAGVLHTYAGQAALALLARASSAVFLPLFAVVVVLVLLL